MNKINWFPGHMKKALNEMAKEVKNIDALIYVLDARAPMACLNPSFFDLIGPKPILFVLNKVDLADEGKLSGVVNKLAGENRKVIMLTSTVSGAIGKVTSALNELCREKIEKFKNKGVNYYVRAMILGVPNSGKSTLTNNLCGRTKAETGNRPGVTKAKQWVKLSNNIEILDTPGALWPNLENENNALRLAFIGSIKDEVLQIEEIALSLIEALLKEYPNALKERYNVKGETPIELMEEIAKARKYTLRDGDYDYERTAKTLLDDFRKGKFGKITLLWNKKIMQKANMAKV